MKKKLLIQKINKEFSPEVLSKAKSHFLGKKNFYGICVMFFMLCFTTQTSAQIVTSSGLSADDYVEIIIGEGIEFDSAVIVGAAGAIASYTGGSDGGLMAVMESGIVMSTGSVASPTALQGPAATFVTGFNGTPGFPELTTIAGQSTNDGIMLQFDFIPQTELLNVNFQFGSEEYNEFVDSPFNDVFAFFISGGPEYLTPQNIALIPMGPGQPPAPVTINTVNCGYGALCASYPTPTPVNCFSYIDNCNGLLNVMDGYTVMLAATAAVTPCETYTIQLMLADAGDSSYDSWVFLQESGFFSVGAVVSNEVAYVGGAGYAYEGCEGNEIVFTIP